VILDVSPSTLSRRGDLLTMARGERDRVLPPSEVLRLARIYRRRSLNDVAHDLIASTPGEVRSSVEAEVESFFERSRIDVDRMDELLEVARAMLPGDLYIRVEAALAIGRQQGDELIGYQPPPDDQTAP
jgi:hypothetical protein